MSTRSFADEVAEATGIDARTVRSDAERGEEVCDEALRLVRGTSLDTGSYLDRLKKVETSEQVYTVQIRHIPATTIAGLAVKARVMGFDAVPMHQHVKPANKRGHDAQAVIAFLAEIEAVGGFTMSPAPDSRVSRNQARRHRSPRLVCCHCGGGYPRRSCTS